MNVWKRLAEILDVELPDPEGEPATMARRPPSSFDPRGVSPGRPLLGAPGRMSQAPGSMQPPRRPTIDRPPPKSPLVTAPNSPQRIGQDIDVRRGGGDDEGY